MTSCPVPPPASASNTPTARPPATASVRTDALTPEAIKARVDAYAGPQGFDHVPILRALKTPPLWLVGEADESIPVRHTLRNLRAAIDSGAAITLRTYPGANHALGAAGGPVPYWTDVIDWLRKERILQ